MKASMANHSQKAGKSSQNVGRASIGIRELKAKASAIIEDVSSRRVTYAVTKRGQVEALIVPVDAGERLIQDPSADRAWNAWQELVDRIAEQSENQTLSAVDELDRMRR